MKVIVTIPAYNEEKTIASVIKEILQVMKSSHIKCTVLVLDDGSQDRTAHIARKAGATVVSNRRNLGLALTFQREMLECLKRKADIIVHSDADGQYPAKYIPKLIKKVKEGYDLVLGSRFIKKGYSGSGMKNIGNRAFSRAISRLTKMKISDSTTGFRAFTRDVAENIKFINTFTYTQEQIIRAAKLHYRIGEIPIETRKTRASRLFSNPFQYAFKAWINIFRIYRDFEPLKFFLHAGLWVMLPAVIIILYLLYNLLTTGHLGYLNFSIIASLFLLAGLQIILFGFMADMLRK